MTVGTRRGRLRRLAAAPGCFALISLAFVLSVEAPYSPSGFVTPNEVYDLPRLVAHKAAGTGVAGNSLEAVQKLLETEIAAFEIDVRLSKDGIPMVLHEETLDGFTTGHGTVGDRTADELSRLRLRANGRDTPYAVPRLEDVLALVGRSKVIFLDAKDASVGDSGMARALSELIRKHDVHPTVVVESFNPVFLWRLRKADPRVRVMFDFADDTTATAEENQAQLAQIPWLLRQEPFRRAVRRLVKPDLLGPRFSVAPARLRGLADYGYPLVAWTVDDPEQAARLVEAGASSIMTNRPLELAEALKGRLERSLDDASRMNRTAVSQLVEAGSEDDVRRALEAARATGRKVSIAGRRHSMGGQTLGPGHVVIDMSRMRALALDDATGILTVGSGASWSDVQRFLDARGRAVLVMQSDNVFSVGGTLSVNAHGWQPRRPPVASTVESFRLMLPSGEVRTCSRSENPELFKGALGGYGLLGVILDARLHTTPNVLYRRSASFLPSAEYPKRFQQRVAGNPAVGLAYGRLSVDSANLLTQSALYVYERAPNPPARLPPMSDEGLVVVKREIFRASERSDGGKRRRWLLETKLGPMLEAPATRNTVMNSDIHLMWPTDLSRRDILHEYFVPQARFAGFLDALRESVRKHGQDLLNVTVRDLRKDDDALLAYAREDVFAFVLLFSQRPSADAEARMQTFTRDLVERALGLGGTFYLPYRLHYTRAQLLRGYPRLPEFLELKRRVDPDELLSSRFYEHIR
jgi:FAD/FMN-containing dehydrogenase/glycerophosphoryl diester phosphodiesterase